MDFQYPVIGAWYEDQEQGQIFEVVAIDEDEATVEVQYLDGDISEFDLESWSRMPLLPAAPPEDANAPYALSQEDRWRDDRAESPSDWNNPLETIEPERYSGGDED